MTTAKTLHFQKTIDIEWRDMDALGHVNNVKYFDYFQQARIDWLSTLDIGLTQSQGPVVVHVGCTFLKPIIYPARLTINCLLHTPGRSSFIIDYDLYQENTLMAQGTSKIVWVDYAKNKAIPVPTKITELLTQ